MIHDLSMIGLLILELVAALMVLRWSWRGLVRAVRDDREDAKKGWGR